MWGKYPPRFSLLGLWPAVSSATPSWVSLGDHPLQDSNHIDKGHPRGAVLMKFLS